jgi:hypothetical protein
MMPFEWIWDTSLSALLAAMILWATLELAESQRWLDWGVYGVLWGLALMTNPALGVLLPFLLGWVVFHRCRESAARWKHVALAAGIAILCCVPWTIRNYVVFHRLIPVRSNLPFELWLGNNDIFDEHARNGRKSITRTEEARSYAQLGETAYMQKKWQLAISFMRAHPGLELRLTGRKFTAFWMGTESPLRNFHETDSYLIRTILLTSFVSGIGALFGIVALSRNQNRTTQGRGDRRGRAEGQGTAQIARPLTWPVAVFPVLFPCLYCVTHADLRYRHPIDPIVSLLTAIAFRNACGFAMAQFRGTKR